VAFVAAIVAWIANYFSGMHRFIGMNFQLIGVNHNSAPVEVRERWRYRNRGCLML
jgi:hypothetical protein